MALWPLKNFFLPGTHVHYLGGEWQMQINVMPNLKRHSATVGLKPRSININIFSNLRLCT